MHCAVYKSRRKVDTYLFVEHEDDFGRVPEQLLTLLGELELVMSLELTPGRRLAQSDPELVRRHLADEGYYLQMPPLVR